MTQKPDLSPPPDGANKGASVIGWLIVAFVPSVISISFLSVKYPSQWHVTALLFIAAGCCLCSAFGMLSGIKEQAVRIVLGLFLAGGLFVLNVIIVVFVGCTNMGRIAP